MDAFGVSMLVAVTYCAALFAVVKFKKIKQDKGRFILINLSILYGLLLVCITLLPISGSVSMDANFVPFRAMLAKTDNGYVFNSTIFFNYWIFSLLNILLFLPFGFFISLFVKTNKLATCIFCGVLASVLIELLQLALPIDRTFDIDDIIFNLLGSIAGYFAYSYIANYLRRKNESIRNQ